MDKVHKPRYSVIHQRQNRLDSRIPGKVHKSSDPDLQILFGISVLLVYETKR